MLMYFYHPRFETSYLVCVDCIPMIQDGFYDSGEPYYRRYMFYAAKLREDRKEPYVKFTVMVEGQHFPRSKRALPKILLSVHEFLNCKMSMYQLLFDLRNEIFRRLYIDIIGKGVITEETDINASLFLEYTRDPKRL